jgi:hypothetical protein
MRIAEAAGEIDLAIRFEQQIRKETGLGFPPSEMHAAFLGFIGAIAGHFIGRRLAQIERAPDYSIEAEPPKVRPN